MLSTMRKTRRIEHCRCYHLMSRLAHRAFFLDDGEKMRAVELLRRVEEFCGVTWSLRMRSFCRALLVDPRQSERFDYETDAYPGKFVFMCYDCSLESDELYENATKKIEKLLGCNNDWVKIVKAWK